MAKIKVGVVGLGMMGFTHLDAYHDMEDVEVIALADANPKRLSGEERPGGNIEGQAQGGFDFSKVRKYTDAQALINDPDVQVVDICVPTPGHLEWCKAAFAAKKHVLVEKPLARTAADARQIAELAKAAGVLAMPAHCMRFWPGWTWLKAAVSSAKYGKVLSASFKRTASHPAGPFYKDGAACGGAALDLHIHDTDFVMHLFGMPASVSSSGYSSITSEPDHLFTQYHFPGGPVVTAEGGWAMTQGYPFVMQYTVNFEKATAVFDISAENPLRLYEAGKEPVAIDLPKGMGYAAEIAYFIQCVKTGKQPETVTLAQGADALRIIEAEVASVKAGGKSVAV